MAQNFPHLHFIILCDDYGTELWPVARRQAPACFAPTEPGSSESLLSSIARHLKPYSAAPLHLVTTPELSDAVSGELSVHAELEPSEYELLIPPAQRGSAFSIALACARIRRKDPDAIVAIFPGNLRIGFDDRWEHLIYHTYQVALRDRLVLLGVQRQQKCAGTSFIKTAAQFEGIEDAFEVRRLALNASEPAAERAVHEGALWYTGVIFGRTAVVLGALQHAPETSESPVAPEANRIVETAGFLSLIELRKWKKDEARELVEALPSGAYDELALAGNKQLVAVPTTIGFDALTSLVDLDTIAEPDDQGNRGIGNAVTIASRGTTVYGEQTTRQITTYGLEDVLVVDTPDALLVADKGKLASQEGLVDKLEQAGVAQVQDSARRSFVWGEAVLLMVGELYAVWRLEIRPGMSYDTLTLPFEYDVMRSLRRRNRPELHERYSVLEGDVLIGGHGEQDARTLVGAGDGFTAQSSRPVQVRCVDEAPALLVVTAVVDPS